MSGADAQGADSAQKREALRVLARKRQATRLEGFAGIGDYHGGVYECDFVSPYSKSAHNVDSSVAVVLQDWSSHDRLAGPLDQDAIQIGHTPSLPTNKNLQQLLRAHFGVGLADIYATNLFPFIKQGDLSAGIPARTLAWAATEFTWPELDIVAPRLVVCLGLPCFNAMRVAAGLERCPNLTAALAAAFEKPLGGAVARIWCQSHPGGLGRANRNRGGVDRVSADWAQMAASARQA